MFTSHLDYLIYIGLPLKTFLTLQVVQNVATRNVGCSKSAGTYPMRSTLGSLVSNIFLDSKRDLGLECPKSVVPNLRAIDPLGTMDTSQGAVKSSKKKHHHTLV